MIYKYYLSYFSYRFISEKTEFLRKSGPISGPDRSFESEIGPVRIFYWKIRTKIRTGPKFLKRNWSGPDFFILKKKSGPRTGPQKNPDRYGLSGPKIRTRTGPMKSGPKYPDHGPDQKNPDRNIRTTDRTKKIRTEISVPRTGPKKSGPNKIRTTDRTGPFRTGGPGNHVH